MYSRFFRWATDRLIEDGVLAFITNRSFIESRTFDGFRKMVAQDFNEIWLVDLGGDVRANPKLSGTKHNVFGIQTGVAICYLVRKKGVEGCTIRYVRRPEDETAEDKLSWLGGADLKSLNFGTIKPDVRNDWLSQREKSEWDDFLPLADKKTKAATVRNDEKALFKFFTLGVVTARDDWVYAETDIEISNRLNWFIAAYEKERKRLPAGSRAKRRDTIILPEKDSTDSIKFTRALKDDLGANTPFSYEPTRNRNSLYRPFDLRRMHYWSRLNEMPYQTERAFPDAEPYPNILISGQPAAKPFQTFACEWVPSYDTLEKTECLPRYRYTKSGERVDNITDWAVAQFVGNYSQSSPSLLGEGDHPQDGGGAAALKATPTASAPPSSDAVAPAATSPSKLREDLGITKDAIFVYCYAVLHDPLYREKYALNLKREFPRIPFYPDFDKWVEWGEALLKLHIDYEKVKPAKLKRVDTPAPKRAEETHPKPKLKSDAALGVIVIDEDTQLTGVPLQAWEYRLGNRSAIDWVLDQHKEKTPRDPTIREKFNTYRFADYKESCIELLGRVVTVSVETVTITEAMKSLDRSGWA